MARPFFIRPGGRGVAAPWWIRRTIGTAQAGKAPAITEDIRSMVAALPADLLGVRDRALVLVGFAGAFRRSELVGLNVADLDFGNDGLTITLRRSKTDQEGEGRKVGLPFGSTPETCPELWSTIAHIAHHFPIGRCAGSNTKNDTCAFCASKSKAQLFLQRRNERLTGFRAACAARAIFGP